MARFIVPVNQVEGQLSAMAAQWLARFYPFVDVVITDRQIVLTSQLSDAELRGILAAALFNERALGEAASRRRQLLEGLLR